MARTNSMVLPVGFPQSNMAEACSLPLRAMHTAPAPGLQQIYVTINQLVVLCSQTPLKFIAHPPERARVICLCYQYKPGSHFLK